jgi:hypothetical protein
MTGPQVSVTHSANLNRWVTGFAAMAEEAALAARPAWTAATEVFFANTQTVVHVLTGRLKQSGRMAVRQDGSNLIGTVTYGGGEVDYAQTERERGGSHDYIARAWQVSEATYREALPEVWQQIRRSWT